MSNSNVLASNINNDILDPLIKQKYFDAYNAYMLQMTKYCTELDNVIYDPLCTDFIDKNELLKDTNLYPKLKLQRTKACLSNTNTTLNSICEKLNIIPIVNTTYNINSNGYVKKTSLDILDITILASTGIRDYNHYIYLPIVRPSVNGKYNILNHSKLSISPKGSLIITDTSNSNVVTISPELNVNNISNYSLYLAPDGNLILGDGVDIKNIILVTNIPESERKKPPFYFGCDKSLNLFILDSEGKYIWNSTPTTVKTLALINTDSSNITLVTNISETGASSTTSVLNHQFYKGMGMWRSHEPLDINRKLPIKGPRGGSLHLLENGNLMTYDIKGQIAWASNTADLGFKPYKLIFSSDGSLKLIDSKETILMFITFNNTVSVGPYGLYVNDAGIINIISLSGMLCDNKPCPPLWTSLDYGYFNVYPNIKDISKTEVNTVVPPVNTPLISSTVIPPTNNPLVSSQVAATEKPTIEDVAITQVASTSDKDKPTASTDSTNTPAVNTEEKTFFEKNMLLLIILVVCVLVFTGVFILKKRSNSNIALGIVPSTVPNIVPGMIPLK